MGGGGGGSHLCVCDIVLIAVCGTLINCFNYISLSKLDFFVGGVVFVVLFS